jgi:hypothetical protein
VVSPADAGDPNFHSPEAPVLLSFEHQNRARLGGHHASNPGVAVRISDSCESVLTELETDGSGEEALLLPCLARSSAASSPRRAGREKRGGGRQHRHSSSSDKENLSSPGNLTWVRCRIAIASLVVDLESCVCVLDRIPDMLKALSLIGGCWVVVLMLWVQVHVTPYGSHAPLRVGGQQSWHRWPPPRK